MTTFHALSSTYLKPNGAKEYRFLALFDNDMAGRRPKTAAMDMDASMVEFRDVLCIHPILKPEPPRDLRRLQLLREWSHEQDKHVFTRGARACRSRSAEHTSD